MIRILMLSLALLVTGLANAAPKWLASVDDKSGLPVVSMGGSDALSASLTFWGKDWAWTELDTAFKGDGDFRYALTGRNKTLDFDLAADVAKAGERQLVWDIRLDARSARQDIVGGGLIFRFDLAQFAASMGEPALLPDNKGWRWGRAGGPQVEMRFEPALAKIYFEPGGKSELRAFFYAGRIAAGTQRHSATLTVSNDVALAPTLAERLGGPAQAAWQPDPTDTRSAAVDLSFLNKSDRPAGRRGKVSLKGDQLQFEDGTQARFWGTNVTAYALFSTPKDTVRQQARRLAALGFNLVRIHHHDSPWVDPNIFGGSKFAKGTQSLNPDSLDKLDWWIKCLKDEGIYVWLDLHAQREFRAEDNIYGFDEIRKGKDVASPKGYNYVNLTIQKAMRRFNEDYLGHRNAYTGVANKDEPAIIALLITNENDLTNHFGNALLPNQNVPHHNKLYMSEAEGFARATGLPKDAVWRSWEPGPSKVFLNDLERRFNKDMIDHLRGLGVKVPLATTNTWGNDLNSLPALTAGDLIDVHAYGGPGQLEKNPLLGANLAHWMAAGQVVGMPLTVTEWNAEPFPLPDRHTLPVYIAAAATHQGWDAMMQYAYTQEPTEYNTPANWNAYNDPSLIAMLPAAALLYRERHVREATTTYVFDAGRDLFFNQAISPVTSVALRTAAEKGKLLIAMPQTKELPWLERKPIPAGATVLRDPNQSVLPANADEATSDTGELKRNWSEGVYTVSTPRSQVALGWIGGKTIRLPDVDIEMETRNASVAVQSLDGAAIGQSKDILVSLAARAEPQRGNRGPLRVEPIRGTLRIRAPRGLKALRLAQTKTGTEVPAHFANGIYTITLDGKKVGNWIVLKPAD